MSRYAQSPSKKQRCSSAASKLDTLPIIEHPFLVALLRIAASEKVTIRNSCHFAGHGVNGFPIGLSCTEIRVTRIDAKNNITDCRPPRRSCWQRCSRDVECLGREQILGSRAASYRDAGRECILAAGVTKSDAESRITMLLSGQVRGRTTTVVYSM